MSDTIAARFDTPCGAECCDCLDNAELAAPRCVDCGGQGRCTCETDPELRALALVFLALEPLADPRVRRRVLEYALARTVNPYLRQAMEAKNRGQSD